MNNTCEYLSKDPKDQTFSRSLHLMCAAGCLVLGLGGCELASCACLGVCGFWLCGMSSDAVACCFWCPSDMNHDNQVMVSNMEHLDC